MMKLAAIVPLNRRAQAKTRLASLLDATSRATLSRWLACGVLDALRRAEIGDIGVVSPDDEVLRWAWQRGAVPVRQAGSGLNEALEVGREWANRRAADALLVVLGDLPLLTADDIGSLVALAASDPAKRSVTIAPDRMGRGTNMLLLRPPTSIPFAFGEESLIRHIALARSAGIEPGIAHLPGAAFDVDTPADVRELAERGLWRPPVTHPDLCEGEAS